MPAVVEDPCRGCGHSLITDHRKGCGCCTACGCSGGGPLSELDRCIATFERARVDEESWAVLVHAGKVLARHIKAHDHCDHHPIACHVNDVNDELKEIGIALSGAGDPSQTLSARVRALKAQRDRLVGENAEHAARVDQAVRAMRRAADRLVPPIMPI